MSKSPTKRSWYDEQREAGYWKKFWKSLPAGVDFKSLRAADCTVPVGWRSRAGAR